MLASIGKGHYAAAFDTGMDMLHPFPLFCTQYLLMEQVLHCALIFLVPTCTFFSITFRAVACLYNPAHAFLVTLTC
jgi:hypothetical protein